MKRRYTQEEKKQLLANLDIEGISLFAVQLEHISSPFIAYSRTPSPPI